jgi:ElaB/YqjD/DUF883 family membrane-anchored ribosome-binding protein
MADFNKQSTLQPPYWKPENRVAGDAGSGAGTAARMKLADKAADMKDRVTDFGRKAVDTLDHSRETAAEALDATASTLHSRGDQLCGAAYSAASKIHSTANYVRNTDLKGMADDVEHMLKRHPVQTLAAAAFLGFLVGRAFRGYD